MDDTLGMAVNPDRPSSPKSAKGTLKRRRGELGSEPYQRISARQHKSPGREIDGREEAAGTLDTEGSLRSECSETKVGNAVNLMAQGAAATALSKLKGEPSRGGEGFRGEMLSCKIASEIAP